MFEEYLTSGLKLHLEQLDIGSPVWEKGPRLRMSLKLFPLYIADSNSSHMFNDSEVLRIVSKFTNWKIQESDIFGPYELLSLTISDLYKKVFLKPSSDSTLSKGALAGIILGAIAGGAMLSAIVFIFIIRSRVRGHHILRKRHLSKASLKIEGVKEFGYREMALATSNFHDSTVVGQGGYGKVYRGILSDNTAVAIKRAQEGSLQGEKEFLTEIQLLSRLHHRNLVALIGYCDEEGEQMLAYEFMSNGTLRDHLSGTIQLFFVKVAYESGKFFSIIDGRLGSYPAECVERFVTLALKCCQDDTDARPSMAEVVRTLESIWLMLPESDVKIAEPLISDVIKVSSTPSSSTNMNNYYMSEVSGSDLVSGITPTITPR
ncbi:putative LRR receptor-like serine/threonine-protein kinase, partial [Cucurbita argyrosperma subsp. argyrosperma]